ncbi:MAG: T9SS type A sorting domain-containing protein [Sporocytophaga sp.]|uniref:DUF7619 domain-containing protein n=1 Tax=Sporocytophaga sp. TaxID=2231183 RepID=UPI001B05CCA3|nr:T9SS type A sorting domain-containing protein [Sporocytophaga sp.]MBO9703273.1 T9SS type A sorting domain-containing protein [Sporocytophaga sp.]
MKIINMCNFFLTILLIFCTILGLECNAQSIVWGTTSTGPSYEYADKPAFDSQGNIIMIGYFFESTTFGDIKLTANGSGDIYIAKFDKRGICLWAKNIGGNESIYYDEPVCMTVDSDDNIIMVGKIQGSDVKIENVPIPGSGPYAFIKLDKNGNMIWGNLQSNNITAITNDSNNNIYVTGTFEQRSFYYGIELIGNQKSSSASLYVIKLTPDRTGVWGTVGAGDTYGGYVNASGICLDSLGNVFITGRYYRDVKLETIELSKPEDDEGSYLTKLNSNGKPLWAKELRADFYYPWDISADNVGNTVVVGQTSLGQNSSQIFASRFDAEGIAIWQKSWGQVGRDDQAYGVQLDNLSNAFIFGCFGNLFNYGDKTLFAEPQGATNAFVSKIAPSGNFIWAENYFTAERKGGIDIDKKGLIAICNRRDDVYKIGNKTFNNLESDATLLLIKDDFTTSINYNYIQGKVFIDENGNCNKDENERGLSGRIIVAEPGDYYDMTDINGNFRIVVDEGSRDLKIRQVIKANLDYVAEQSCPANNQSISVSLTGSGKVYSGYNFGNKGIFCPLLNVSLVKDRMRRCFPGQTFIHYSNEGSDYVEDATIKLTTPSVLRIQNSSMPFTRVNDTTLIFHTGLIAQGGGGAIIINDSIMCSDETIRGRTYCMEAKISPSNSCINYQKWDKSDLIIKTSCLSNGILQVVILNQGTGDMSDSTQLRIFYNSVLAFKKQMKISAGKLITLKIPASGKTIRIEADQNPFHPEKEKAISTFEGCGKLTDGSIAKNFVNDLSVEEGGFQQSTKCFEVRDSFDPNDKSVLPRGCGQGHGIFSTDWINYTIRFQNTGNDVAYNVIVEDTLDKSLDIETLSLTGGSHNYTWNLQGKGNAVLKLFFNNIYLPDSTSDEKNSHGFISFKIKPKATILPGTVIKNKSLIYFDYNSPVITNELEQTIVENCGEDLTLGKDIEIDYNPDVTNTVETFKANFFISPNPFSDYLIINTNSNTSGRYNLKVSDIYGKLVLSATLDGSEKILPTENFNNGYYFYLLEDENGSVSSGKLLKIK